MEGVFYEGQRLTVTERSLEVPEEEVLGAWTLHVNDYDGELTVRLYAPEGGKASCIGEESVLTPLDATRDGSYLVFKSPNGASVALTRDAASAVKDLPWGYAAGGAGIGVLLVLLALMVRAGKEKTGEKATGAKASGRKASGKKAGGRKTPAPAEKADTAGSDAAEVSAE